MGLDKLIGIWKKVADDLQIEIETPFILNLSDGNKVTADVLVKQFGAQKGMLIFKDYSLISQFSDEIISKGYGYSILDEPGEKENYIRDEYIELLNDWGWSSESSKPEWLVDDLD